jgi:hypothetical protein
MSEKTIRVPVIFGEELIGGVQERAWIDPRR